MEKILDVDLLREMIGFASQRLMEPEVRPAYRRRRRQKRAWENAGRHR